MLKHSHSKILEKKQKNKTKHCELGRTTVSFLLSLSFLEGLPTASVGSVVLMPTRLVERSTCLR